MKHRLLNKIIFFFLLTALMLSVECPVNAQSKLSAESKTLGASSDKDSVTVQRTADIVFVIDTTGSMYSPIRNVRNQLNVFFESVSKEDVDVRVRLVSFRDITCDRTAGFTTYPTDGGWYTKDNIKEAEEQLTKGDFIVNGGGDYEETPLVSLTDILKDENYFVREDGKETLGRFCILITDADYKDVTYGTYYDGTAFGATGYVDTTASLGAVSTPIGIVEKMKERGIHTSVITCESSSLKIRYAKFVTPPSSPTSGDGGMLADIAGNYSILFEELSKRIQDITIERAEEAVSLNKNLKPVKVKANMIVLRKEPNCTYQIASGKLLDADGKIDETGAVWSEPQESVVFKGLTPSSYYTFKVTEKAEDGTLKYDYYTLKTESTTGGRFKNLPNTIYEGEVYNVKPDNDLTKMLATSGSSITWSCNSDCVAITKDDVGQGCQMSVVDCQYNNNKPITITLVADVEYYKKEQNGKFSMKSKKLKKKMKVENTVDALELGEFHGTSENIYKDGLVILGTKEAVTFDMIINQGELSDTASKQKLAFFISDVYGEINNNGRKIAKVSGRKIIGVNPGVTYVTIAPKHTYNKYGRCYDFSMTIPILCREVESVSFDSIKLEAEDDNILMWMDDPSTNESGDYVVYAHKGDKIDLKPYVKYNPENAFNQQTMKESWISSDTEVVTVDKKGRIRCKSSGYAVVMLTPTGGLKISAATGKRDINSKLCSTSIIIKVVEEEKAE